LSRVSFFEIPVTDLDRAVRFYTAVLGVELVRVEVDGNLMALFPDDGGPGACGALASGDSYRPSLDGTRVYLGVDEIDAVLGRVVEHDGRVLYPKTSIGELGHVAEFEGSEGNRIALSAP
jgi:predicted enzyme related to lactoylglutathione lyase